MPLKIDPPLLNSANPWATDLSYLRPLYASPYTGAVTTRTSLLGGFAHRDAVHQYAFFSPLTHAAAAPVTTLTPGPPVPLPPADARAAAASLNTLGYSPVPLSGYLDFVSALSAEATRPGSSLRTDKPVLVSVTGSADEVAECYARICERARSVCMPLAMEINLSCPNIPDKPPPAYSAERLVEYLVKVKEKGLVEGVPVGVKTPPYTHAGMFAELVGALRRVVGSDGRSVVSFVTATNTLAPSLVLSDGEGEGLRPALGSVSGLGLGGMAGAPLHPLALGNVLSISEALRGDEKLEQIMVIGVGGVEDADGFRRMKKVGASAVGVGTALGRFGVDVFEKIWKGWDTARL